MIEKITEEEIRSLGVSSLPRSPSAPSLYGGRSMDSVALRAAFDRLPICIARKVNALIDGLGLAGEEGATVAELLATGLFEGHSLEDLFGDIASGRFAAYLKFEDGERLADKAARWEALHGETVKRLFETDALYAERAGVTVGIPYGEEPQPYTVPLRGDGGELEDVARHDASDTSHADLRKRLAEVERETALRSRARVFDTWEDALLFCTAFDEEEAKEAFSVGDRLLIRDGEVPDGWVSGFAKAAMPYPGGNGIREPFDGDTAVTVGWVILSPLEGPKVDLSEYGTRTETEEKIEEAASALSEKKADRSALARLEARVENLRANVAPEYFVTDAAAAYTKTVPDTALPFAEVKEVGGMSYAEGGEIKNAAVTALESVGVNIFDISAVKRTYPIPAEVQALEGWGLGVNETYHNRLLWAEKKYRQEVARYVFTGDNLTNWEDSNRNFVGLYLDNVIPYLSDTGNDIRAVCNDFTVYARVPLEGERGIGFRQTSAINRLYIRDDSFSSAADFKAYFAEKYASGNPVTIDYVLASPIITDLPDLPDDNFIEVEGGGTVTAVNGDELAAPTKIEYQLKEATV